MSLRINPRIARLVDSATGEDVPTGDFSRPIGLAPSGKPVEVAYDMDAVRAELDSGGWPNLPGILRYSPLLPVEGLSPTYAADVGATATTTLSRIGESLNVDLWVKSEASNPSGSFKDRGLSIGVALGVACGAKRFCLPTQGNAGVASALFSSRMGLSPALVYMPDGYQDNAYHRACAHYGGEVRFFGANIGASGKEMRSALREELESGEYVDISTFFEPGRLEGKKTMGLEIWETFGRGGLPDWIFYPTGGGTGLVGIWKAFRELAELGRVDAESLPRMVAVQSEQCCPVVKSFHAGHAEVEPVVSKGTVADGLDVPGAIMGHRMLAVLRASKGTAVAVAEEAIRDDFRELGRCGFPAGYETAALLAALREMRSDGQVTAGERVLLVSTSGPTMALGS